MRRNLAYLRNGNIEGSSLQFSGLLVRVVHLYITRAKVKDKTLGLACYAQSLSLKNGNVHLRATYSDGGLLFLSGT